MIRDEHHDGSSCRRGSKSSPSVVVYVRRRAEVSASEIPGVQPVRLSAGPRPYGYDVSVQADRGMAGRRAGVVHVSDGVSVVRVYEAGVLGQQQEIFGQ